MNKTALVIASLTIALLAGVPLVHSHEGHEIDRELLASKIRERGHACTSVKDAHEESDGPTVIAVKCADGNAYRLVISATDFEVNPVPTASAPEKPHPAH